MEAERPGTYCQNCLTWNPGGRESCRKCGTRLLIVTGDQTWEEPEAVVEAEEEDLDEHLLERITGLEEGLRRVETYLETVSEQLGKLERSEVMLRNGLMALVAEMEQKGRLDAHAFTGRWEQMVEENLQLIGARETFTRYRARILPIARPRSMSQLRRALLETSAFLENSQLGEAADRLAEALNLDPRNYELVYTVAALKEVAKATEEAEQLARRAVQISPRHYEAWMLLARLLGQQPDRADQALEALGRAAELRPEELEPRVRLAEQHLEEEDLQAALEAAEAAVGLARNGETLALLGEVLVARGEAQAAISVLKEASGHLPGDLRVRELLAEGYLHAGERQKAFRILEELLAQHPGDPELLLLMDARDPAQLRSARGGKLSAQRLLDEAESWMEEGNAGEAEACLRRARRRGKSDRLDFLETQHAYLKSPAGGRSRLAAFAASDRHPRLCFQALRLLMDHDMQGPEEAMVHKALDAFLAAHPKSSGAWEAALMRQAWRLLGGTLSEEDLLEVRRLQAHPLPGQEGRARTLLCQYLLALGRPGEVIELLGPVLEKEPTVITHFQLGAALAGDGEREEALEILRLGLEAEAGDLQPEQVEGVKSQMQALIADLEKAGVPAS
ncbi:MAG: tetratricopeptide repeat protein [Acidobacteria bacterium]|nr:tetratricopeptide repeat protein [Acidobacteriota bacterium]